MENQILFLWGFVTVYTITGCGVFLLCMLILYTGGCDEYVQNEKPFTLLLLSLLTGIFWIFFIPGWIKRAWYILHNLCKSTRIIRNIRLLKSANSPLINHAQKSAKLLQHPSANLLNRVSIKKTTFFHFGACNLYKLWHFKTRQKQIPCRTIPLESRSGTKTNRSLYCNERTWRTFDSSYRRLCW